MRYEFDPIFCYSPLHWTSAPMRQPPGPLGISASVTRSQLPAQKPRTGRSVCLYPSLPRYIQPISLHSSQSLFKCHPSARPILTTSFETTSWSSSFSLVMLVYLFFFVPWHVSPSNILYNLWHLPSIFCLLLLPCKPQQGKELGLLCSVMHR